MVDLIRLIHHELNITCHNTVRKDKFVYRVTLVCNLILLTYTTMYLSRISYVSLVLYGV